MGRDWSRRKASDQAQTAKIEHRRLMNELARDEPQPSKKELRAEAAAAVAAYRGPVRRLPMFAALRCRTCGHRGTARVPVDAEPRFKCSACGSSLVAWQV